MIAPVSAANAQHYRWGAASEAWHLLQRDDLSILLERVPAGDGEVRHYHEAARQFFFILEGEGSMVIDDQEIPLGKGCGLEIAPGVPHRFFNRSGQDVHFLVVSMPPSHGDRINS